MKKKTTPAVEEKKADTPRTMGGLPHILRIENTIKEKGSTLVSLFNPGEALFSDNFGNPEGIKITYLSNNPLVPYSYQRFLFCDSYMHIGKMETRSTDAKQAYNTITWLNNVGLGAFEGLSIFPYKLKSKRIKGVHIGTSTNIWITPKTQLSFEVKNGVSVDLYLYPTKVFDPIKEIERLSFELALLRDFLAKQQPNTPLPPTLISEKNALTIKNPKK